MVFIYVVFREICGCKCLAPCQSNLLSPLIPTPSNLQGDPFEPKPFSLAVSSTLSPNFTPGLDTFISKATTHSVVSRVNKTFLISRIKIAISTSGWLTTTILFKMAATALGNAPISHKRSSSTAGNTAEEPQCKRQAPNTANPALPLKSTGFDYEPHYVYVVMVDSNPEYTEAVSDIHAIYATIKDANNAVKGNFR